MTVLKIGAIRWDWREMMPTDDLNEILQQFDEAIMIENVDTKSDEVGLLVYNKSSKLFQYLLEDEKDKLWMIWQGLADVGFDDEFPNDMNENLHGELLHTTVERFKEMIAEVSDIYGE